MNRFAAVIVATAAFVPLSAAAQTSAQSLTRAQLEDADLVDAQGREIGEVERVMTDGAGKVTGVVVEVDQADPRPDKLVQLPLSGLTAVPELDDPTEFDIRTSQTTAQLLALPAWTPR